MALLATYLPHGQFAFPRAYARGFRVRTDDPVVVVSDNVVSFIIAGPPDALCKVTFQPDFMGFSSNRWTLDHILVSATYEYPPAPPVFDLPFYLYWDTYTGGKVPLLGIDTSYGAFYETVYLPGGGGGYWTPTPAI